MSTSSCCLHGFCDASFGAYAAVIYLVTRTTSKSCVWFVASKTRVTPRRELTIPRLELLSALLLARLLGSVMKSLSPNLSLSEPTCYTDSQVALYWIVSQGKHWKQFVQNHVVEIRELTPPDCWKHCAGSENPADLPSRGLTPTELSTSKLWHYGPDWLWRKADESDVRLTNELPTDCTDELKSRDVMAHTLLTGDAINLENVIQCNRYSSLSHLLSVTMHVLKFVQALKQAIEQCDSDRSSSSILYLTDSSQAEFMWVQEAQRHLVKDRHFQTWTKQLGLYQDKKGVWRCAGQLQYANVSTSAKHPYHSSQEPPFDRPCRQICT